VYWERIAGGKEKGKTTPGEKIAVEKKKQHQG